MNYNYQKKELRKGKQKNNIKTKKKDLYFFPSFFFSRKNTIWKISKTNKYINSLNPAELRASIHLRLSQASMCLRNYCCLISSGFSEFLAH